MTPDTQAPDFAGIARKMADTTYPPEPWIPNYGHGHWFNGYFISDPHADERDDYASCMEARLRADWETIRLLRVLPHADDCNAWDKRDIDTDAGTWEWVTNPDKCTCGLSAHLSKLLEPFTP